ncbi:VOC family protein [Tessaracoccus antarcticus]|uniref:VOC family protein n=2 Tax=Tessaracoccus antarcticus TaxID=2479848 RepID=A0A3M0GYJ4_9ACTN|nr:VOC family protein [Tessaracoccus antarcticus]
MGAAIANQILGPSTGVGPVTLKVGDLDAMAAYYSGGLGLHVLNQKGSTITLGQRGVPAVVLEHTPLLTHAPTSAAGLFHTALLFDDPAGLASSIYSLARHYPSSFTGSADHSVSKAFYFDDPEGNGVELYWDRPRAEWGWKDGRVRMTTDYLDPNKFLRDNLAEDGAGQSSVGAATVGHVHLKVGDIETARAFYVDTVGFEITAEIGTQALFVSAGGYHHHLAMNTWHSRGATGRWPALGLGEVTIDVGSEDDLGGLQERLTSRSIAIRNDGNVLAFEDPWKNEIQVRVGA